MTGPSSGSPGSSESGQLTQVEGFVQPQGLSTYMYGTHVLTSPSGQVLFALTAATPELLDRLVGKRARLYGSVALDYPVDGGPLNFVVSRADELTGE